MCYSPSEPMALDSAITVRLSNQEKARLADLAEQAGLKPADLIRRAIGDFLLHAEQAGSINLSLAESPEGLSRNPKAKPPKKPVKY